MFFDRLDKRGIWAACGAAAVYVLDPLLTIARLNVENLAAANHLDKLLLAPELASFLQKAYTALVSAWQYLSGDFAIGFAAAAILFATWDVTALALSRSRRATAFAEESARRWEELAHEIFVDLGEAYEPRTPFWAAYPSNATEHEKDRIFDIETSAASAESKARMDRFERRYRARLEMARADALAQEAEISIPGGRRFTNPFDWDDAAKALIAAAAQLRRQHSLTRVPDSPLP